MPVTHQKRGFESLLDRSNALCGVVVTRLSCKEESQFESDRVLINPRHASREVLKHTWRAFHPGSSVGERLSYIQDVVGSIPTRGSSKILVFNKVLPLGCVLLNRIQNVVTGVERHANTHVAEGSF